MSEPTSRFATVSTVVRGCQIRTRVSQVVPAYSQPSIVLVHGLGVSACYLMPLAEQLASHFRLLIPDLPGFGDSGKPKNVLDIPELADYVREWMPTVGLTHAVFLGNSLGCQVIVDLAVRYPHYINAAVLIGPTVDPRDRTMLGQLWRGFRDLCREPWSLWPTLFYDYLVTGTRRMLQTFKYVLKDPVEQKLPLMSIPTLVVRGGRDTIVPQARVERMIALLPNGRLLVIPRGTHAANYSTPVELAAAVREYVDSLSLEVTRSS